MTFIDNSNPIKPVLDYILDGQDINKLNPFNIRDGYKLWRHFKGRGDFSDYKFQDDLSGEFLTQCGITTKYSIEERIKNAKSVYSALILEKGPLKNKLNFSNFGCLEDLISQFRTLHQERPNHNLDRLADKIEKKYSSNIELERVFDYGEIGLYTDSFDDFLITELDEGRISEEKLKSFYGSFSPNLERNYESRAGFLELEETNIEKNKFIINELWHHFRDDIFSVSARGVVSKTEASIIKKKIGIDSSSRNKQEILGLTYVREGLITPDDFIEDLTDRVNTFIDDRIESIRKLRESPLRNEWVRKDVYANDFGDRIINLPRKLVLGYALEQGKINLDDIDRAIELKDYCVAQHFAFDFDERKDTNNLWKIYSYGDSNTHSYKEISNINNNKRGLELAIEKGLIDRNEVKEFLHRMPSERINERARKNLWNVFKKYFN